MSPRRILPYLLRPHLPISKSSKPLPKSPTVTFDQSTPLHPRRPLLVALDTLPLSPLSSLLDGRRPNDRGNHSLLLRMPHTASIAVKPLPSHQELDGGSAAYARARPRPMLHTHHHRPTLASVTGRHIGFIRSAILTSTLKCGAWTSRHLRPGRDHSHRTCNLPVDGSPSDVLPTLQTRRLS